MKVSFEREKFMAAFQTAATIAPARSPKPILQNVRLDVGDKSSILMATDMEIGIRLELADVEVKATGNAVLPAQQFGALLRESSDEKIHLETDGNSLIVKGDRSKFNLPVQNPDEFPSVASFDEKKYHECSARLMKELVKRTLFATDTESSRYALGGVLIEFEKDKIVAVGTDGRRLAKMEGEAKSVGGHESGESMTIVPSRSMQLIDRALQESDGEIQLAARSNDILIKTPRATIYSRLVEGRFPKWREVFPDRNDGSDIELTVGPLFTALRQAAIVASEDSRGIDFVFEKGTLQLDAQSADVGESHVEVPISYDGEPISMALDHRFVADFLKALDAGKTFTLNLKDAQSAALCTTDDGYGYVVMPLARDREVKKAG